MAGKRWEIADGNHLFLSARGGDGGAGGHGEDGQNGGRGMNGQGSTQNQDATVRPQPHPRSSELKSLTHLAEWRARRTRGRVQAPSLHTSQVLPWLTESRNPVLDQEPVGEMGATGELS